MESTLFMVPPIGLANSEINERVSRSINFHLQRILRYLNKLNKKLVKVWIYKEEVSQINMNIT